MNHLIQHQRLDIAWNGPENEAFAFQYRLSDWTTSMLIPAVVRALDRCVPVHTYLRVEQLEIIIDDVPAAQWEEALPQKIAEAVAAAITAQLQATQQGTTHGTILKTAPQRTAEAWGYFLQTGFLPWHYPAAEAHGWEDTLRPLFFQPAFKQMLRSVLEMPVARERLVGQFSVKFLEELLASLQPTSAPQLKAFLAAIDNTNTTISIDLKTLIIKNIQLETWNVVGQNKKVTIRDVLQRVIPQLPQEIPQPFQHWPALFGAILKEANLPEKTKNKVKFGLDVKIHRESLQPIADFKNKEVQPLPTSEIYLANAGIVLLYSFLPRLFEGILCATDDQLVRPDKAALALLFLATGQVQASEYELPLAKILCGIPLNVPLPMVTDWETHDTEEAEALLQAVVKYWGALKDSSIGLLRTEFLQRAGKLTPCHDGWLLQVERRDFDFLLEQLPWGFATIKLPWMTEFLYVEWI